MFAQAGLQLARTLNPVGPHGIRRLVSADRNSMFCCLVLYSTVFDLQATQVSHGNSGIPWNSEWPCCDVLSH